MKCCVLFWTLFCHFNRFWCVLPRTQQFIRAGEGELNSLINFPGTVGFILIRATAASARVDVTMTHTHGRLQSILVWRRPGQAAATSLPPFRQPKAQTETCQFLIFQLFISLSLLTLHIVHCSKTNVTRVRKRNKKTNLKISFFVVISVSWHCLQHSDVHWGGRGGKVYHPPLHRQETGCNVTHVSIILMIFILLSKFISFEISGPLMIYFIQRTQQHFEHEAIRLNV